MAGEGAASAWCEFPSPLMGEGQGGGGGNRVTESDRATAIQLARALRRRLTGTEQKLWLLLRRKQLDGYRFRRQVPLGSYVADFACLAERLVIEIDGGQHGEAERSDKARTAWLESRGFRVLRFWNNEVLENPDGVLQRILAALHYRSHPPP
ncbi:MAG: endonuclease domain-containing protein [Pseudomonadota bacterium]